MLARRLHIALAAAILGALVLAAPPSAPAAPAGLASRQADVDRAVQDYREGQARLDAINTRIAGRSAELDRLIAAQSRAQARLSKRAQVMYRTGEISFVSVVMGATSFEDFATRWILLTRINQEDAVAIAELSSARKRVSRSAKDLLALQEDAANQMRSLADDVAKARKGLAASQAALAAYNSRIAAAGRASAAASRKTQQLHGKGAWKTGVASHYGANFSGRGASGEHIGPNSMIVAHRTLPFGTLVEIRYNGRTAVARVADRGPYAEGRVFDLGPGVIKVLGFSGVHTIQYRVIDR